MANKQMKDLQSRVDELTAKFDAGIQDLKKICMEDCASSEQVNTLKRDLCSKFGDFEKSVTSSLQSVKNQVMDMQREIESQASKIDRIEREKNRNILLIHGVEEKNADIYEQILYLFTSSLNIDIKKSDINECYRMGQKNSSRSKPRPVVISFVNCWMRDHVFSSKRKLKGSKILITELLTVSTMSLFKDIRSAVGLSTWTIKGQIILLHNGRKIKIDSEEQWLEIKSGSDLQI